MVGRAGSSFAKAICPLSLLLVSGGQAWTGTCCLREGRLVWEEMAGSGGPLGSQSTVTPDMAVPCGQACLLSCVLFSP